MLTLSLNGETVQCEPASNITLLLDQEGYETQKIAVAINGDFVPRSRYGEVTLNNGDEVDVIQAVGGG